MVLQETLVTKGVFFNHFLLVISSFILLFAGCSLVLYLRLLYKNYSFFRYSSSSQGRNIRWIFLFIGCALISFVFYMVDNTLSLYDPRHLRLLVERDLLPPGEDLTIIETKWGVGRYLVSLYSFAFLTFASMRCVVSWFSVVSNMVHIFGSVFFKRLLRVYTFFSNVLLPLALLTATVFYAMVFRVAGRIATSVFLVCLVVSVYSARFWFFSTIKSKESDFAKDSILVMVDKHSKSQVINATVLLLIMVAVTILEPMKFKIAAGDFNYPVFVRMFLYLFAARFLAGSWSYGEQILKNLTKKELVSNSRITSSFFRNTSELKVK